MHKKRVETQNIASLPETYCLINGSHEPSLPDIGYLNQINTQLK
jgi:hypothetical protein